MEERKAIPSHSTATDDGAWDGPANEARIPNDAGAATLRKEYAWIDPEADPATKSAYKFPHHFVSDSGSIGAASLRGCSAGCGVLNGGRGGTTIPDADRQGVWRHLARHLRDGGMTPPELKSLNSLIGFKETRYFALNEVRANTKSLRITGHAAVFNQLSQDLGGFREKIAPGAFADSIDGGDIRALWNHDPRWVLARTKSGTLRLSEDNTGLAIDATLPDATYARDFLASIERGDVDQMSFGFMVIPGGENWMIQDGGYVRELTKVELFDVSPVTFPAYTQTDVAARGYYESKIEELRNSQQQPNLNNQLFLERMKARQEFIDRRTPAPDPFSFAEIIKKAKIANK